MIPQKMKRFGVFAIAFALITGCSSTALIEKVPSADLTKYKTYSWVEKENAEDKTNHVNDIAEQSVRSAVNSELYKSGWGEVKSNPDILLTYDLLVDKSIIQQREPVYSQPYTRTYYNPYTKRFGTIYYPSQFLGYDSYETPVKQGTVVISMIDPQTDKTVWQGSATKELNSNRITAKDVDNNVKSIFKKFEVK